MKKMKIPDHIKKTECSACQVHVKRS